MVERGGVRSMAATVGCDYNHRIVANGARNQPAFDRALRGALSMHRCKRRGFSHKSGETGGQESSGSSQSQRLSLTITKRQRPFDRSAHRPPIKRSSAALAQPLAPLYSTINTGPGWPSVPGN